ncbi:DNA-directed RNA polymerase subunit omega [Candidatus Poribacteria bacterium]|nr:DNA-directed RNA polymerase subunit omega [Candidatus Poribacteria bacterium]
MKKKCLERVPDSDGKYLLINVLSRRAKEFGRGGRPTIPYAEGNFEPIEVAAEELAAGKLLVRSRNEISGDLEKFEDMN